MIQDIEPKIYNNSFYEKKPKASSVIFTFDGKKVLCKQNSGELIYPVYEVCNELNGTYVYLFSIDDIDYFLLTSEQKAELPDYTYETINVFHKTNPRVKTFAAATAYHLNCWYLDNQFCGRCGEKLEHDHKERMLHCNHCNNMVFPKISPAIIVGITDGDKLLMTKYAGREYTDYALIAGFTEIGESIEKTVEREVMEEVGVKIKNIRFYKSQPWAYTSSLLCGFFAELDGDTTITMDQEELAEAGWFSKDEIHLPADDISLTREMILAFVENKY